MKVSEVATAAGVARSVVFSAIRNGQLRARKEWAITEANAARWIASRMRGRARDVEPVALTPEQAEAAELLGEVVSRNGGVAIVRITAEYVGVDADGRIV